MMTTQQEFAADVVRAINSMGVKAEIHGENERFCAIRLPEKGREFFLPPYSAYNNNAGEVAAGIVAA